MYEILVSMFGLVLISRILSHLKSFSLVSKKKYVILFVLLQLPLYILIIFKEHHYLYILYIGFFLVTLIFFRTILSFLAEKTFQDIHLRILDELIMGLKAGKSASFSLKTLLGSLTDWQKTVFKPLYFSFELQNQDFVTINQHHKFYFNELITILNSSSKIIDQIFSFRNGLKIQFNLRRKSRQVTQQIKAQAIVSVGIYLVMSVISWNFLNLDQYPKALLVSLILFLVGQVFIFTLGRRIKWKT